LKTSVKPKSFIRQRFISAKSETLVIETIKTDYLNRRQHLGVIRLKGTWRANSANQLCFSVAAPEGTPKTYTLKGSWKLNNNQQIEYTSEDGRDKLTFQGYWKVSSAKRIVYFLEGSSASRFEFKVQLESASLLPKAGQLRFRLGAGIRRSRANSGNPVVILYGQWKIGRCLGLLFQMDYGQGKLRQLEFGSEVTFGRNKVNFALKDELGKPLGITLTMTHRFLKTLDASAFLKLKSRQKELAIEAGIKVPF
jgi:hypothetical protein